MLNRTTMRGFTLIEAMITLAVLALLFMIGLPGMNTWLQNTQIRTSTEALQAGLQLARAEALRRNVPVRFQLVDSLAGGCALAMNGTSWVVSLADVTGQCNAVESDDVLVSPPQIVQKWSGAEGTPNAVINATVASVVFNGLGRTAGGAGAVQIDVTNAAGGACQPAGPMRCLRINVASGGQMRMCDPAVMDPADPRRC
jgi:type IV fimbrial biogenesis protein FimT